MSALLHALATVPTGWAFLVGLLALAMAASCEARR
jgi:hypothetical protein